MVQSGGEYHSVHRQLAVDSEKPSDTNGPVAVRTKVDVIHYFSGVIFLSVKSSHQVLSDCQRCRSSSDVSQHPRQSVISYLS